uniref:PEST proteolytic signal-containing nuclear protein n=1 Tax=Anopheles atroparvus TaxID=41427 RepID=A0AAG5DVE6_ANOAO
MSRWDRRNDDEHHQERRRDDGNFGHKRSSMCQRESPARSDSPGSPYSGSRSRSRSPPSHHPSRPRASQQTKQGRSEDRQAEEERQRRQEALNSRGRTSNMAGPNGTGPGLGGTLRQMGKRSPSSGVVTAGQQAMHKGRPPVGGIQMKLAAPPSKESQRLMKPIANAFRQADDSDDSEPEEMPAECRMRMRNIGRDTPTSSGPNSFGKTKHGFCDSKKMFEKKLGGGLSDR